MATCHYCGQEIEFRYIDGRCVPIHADGGWECSSWSRDSVVSREDVHPVTREWREQSFTRPTTCPHCRKEVFFIRHNGGSVWVDELGWPWPKHACFDGPHTDTSVFSRWSVRASGLTNPKLGVISCIRPPTRTTGRESFVEIKLGNSIKIGMFLQWMPPEDMLIGALVCVSIEDKLLLHEKYGEIAFYGVVELSLSVSQNAIVQCPRCGAYVIAKNLEKHDKLNCTNPPPQAGP
jgi:hypothetical protein